MNQEVGTEICRVVRESVLRAFEQLDTCIASIRVLEAVLLRRYGIKLNPQVVRLKIYPESVLRIMENKALGADEKIAQVEAIAPRSGIIGLKDGFHLVGVSESDHGSLFWEPSIDQVNKNSDVCHFSPLCVSFARMHQMSDGTNDWIYFDENGCRVMYAFNSEDVKAVAGSKAWNYNYGSVVNHVLASKLP